MAKPVESVPSVVVSTSDQHWQCQVCLEVDGPDAGKYIGLAVNLDSMDTQLTTPMYRILDCMHAIIRQVLYRELPIKNAAEDVKLSLDYAKANGVVSPLK